MGLAGTIVTDWALGEATTVARHILSFENPIATEAENIVANRPMVQWIHFVKPFHFLFRIHLFTLHVYFWAQFIFKQSRPASATARRKQARELLYSVTTGSFAAAWTNL